MNSDRQPKAVYIVDNPKARSSPSTAVAVLVGWVAIVGWILVEMLSEALSSRPDRAITLKDVAIVFLLAVVLPVWCVRRTINRSTKR